jgi:hypothetical protein
MANIIGTVFIMCTHVLIPSKRRKQLTVLKNKTCQSIPIGMGHSEGKEFWPLELRFEAE